MKQLFFFILTMLPIVAKADAVEIDGIYYNLVEKAKIAEVAYKEVGTPGYYSGNLTIPDVVNYNGITYIVNSIGDYAFRNCKNLISVTISDNVTTIGHDAFEHCTGLTTINIPQNLISIGSWAFADCPSLEKVIIKDLAAWCKVEAEDNPLSQARHLYCDNDTEIKELVIPDGVTSVKNFNGCDEITSVIFPNSVISISSFIGCSKLKTVVIPNSVVSIGGFTDCPQLTSFTIPNSVTSIGSVFLNRCVGITSISIPNSVTSIGNSSFQYCTGLSSIIIPNSVKTIGSEAFAGCSKLKMLTVGSGVEKIDGSAFSNCSELSDVYCFSQKVPKTNQTVFKDSYIEYATLHVPSASISAYQSVAPWNRFRTVEAINGDMPEAQKCSMPSINYRNGKLTFSCETEGAQFVSDISDTDIKRFYDAEISLTATYTISVHATKEGYQDSDIATATLCWIDKEPATEGITSVSLIKANAVMIQNNGGILTIQGAEENTPISIYELNGTLAGTGTCRNGIATINTRLKPGSMAVVKIGEKSVKIIVK